MKITSHTIISISRKELLAGAKYQDVIQSLTRDVGNVFGKEIPFPELSSVKQIKMALGGTEVQEFGPMKIEMSKKGAVFTVSFNDELDEKVAIEYFSMVSDVLRIYVPVLVGTATSLMAAQASAQNRIEEGVVAMKKATKG